jgi:hypothetical protein
MMLVMMMVMVMAIELLTEITYQDNFDGTNYVHSRCQCCARVEQHPDRTAKFGAQ